MTVVTLTATRKPLAPATGSVNLVRSVSTVYQMHVRLQTLAGAQCTEDRLQAVLT